MHALPEKSFGNAGFGLAELMVAMAIGLFGILVLTTVYITAEEQKRTTVSGGEAQQNAILALNAIQQDVLMAGYGIVGAGALGCTVNATTDGGSTSYTLQLSPVLIRQDEPEAGTDSITVMYSTASGASGPPALTRANHPDGTAGPFQLDHTIGFRQNDFVVAFQPDKPCTLLQITNDPTPLGNTVLAHDPGPSPYNAADSGNFPAGGYNAQSFIFNLGAQVANFRYEISNGRLVRINLGDGSNAALEVAENIVALRAQYGLDTANPNPAVAATSTTANGDSLVDVYVDPRLDRTPNHAAFGNATQAEIAAGWGRVYSVAVAIVARSNLREKAEVSPATITLWAGGPVYTVPDRNFRYRVYHTIVPLRNLVWRRPGI